MAATVPRSALSPGVNSRTDLANRVPFSQRSNRFVRLMQHLVDSEDLEMQEILAPIVERAVTLREQSEHEDWASQSEEFVDSQLQELLQVELKAKPAQDNVANGCLLKMWRGSCDRRGCKFRHDEDAMMQLVVEQLDKISKTPWYEKLLSQGVVSVKIPKASPKTIDESGAPSKALATQPRQSVQNPSYRLAPREFPNQPPQYRDAKGGGTVRFMDYDHTAYEDEEEPEQASSGDIIQEINPKQEDMRRTIHMIMKHAMTMGDEKAQINILRNLPRMQHVLFLSSVMHPARGHVAVMCILDSGATASCLSNKTFSELQDRLDKTEVFESDNAIRLAAGQDLLCNTHAAVSVSWIWAGERYCKDHIFLVLNTDNFSVVAGVGLLVRSSLKFVLIEQLFEPDELQHFARAIPQLYMMQHVSTPTSGTPVQLERPISSDLERIFDEIATRPNFRPIVRKMDAVARANTVKDDAMSIYTRRMGHSPRKVLTRQGIGELQDETLPKSSVYFSHTPNFELEPQAGQGDLVTKVRERLSHKWMQDTTCENLIDLYWYTVLIHMEEHNTRPVQIPLSDPLYVLEPNGLVICKTEVPDYCVPELTGRLERWYNGLFWTYGYYTGSLSSRR